MESFYTLAMSRTVLFAVITLVAMIIWIGNNLHDATPEVRHWSLSSPELPTLKIALLSDFHFDSSQDLETLGLLKRQLINARPDLILLAGDYLGDRHVHETTSRAQIVAALDALTYPTPAFAVLGNHDNWDGREAWLDAFAGASVTLIENRVAVLHIVNHTICLRGMGDYSSNAWRHTPIPTECEGRTITLTHDPFGLIATTGELETIGFAAHTHCGQIAFPWIGAPIVPTKAPSSMHCGAYTHRFPGITSGGLGTSMLPFRFGPSTKPGWELIVINDNPR